MSKLLLPETSTPLPNAAEPVATSDVSPLCLFRSYSAAVPPCIAIRSPTLTFAVPTAVRAASVLAYIVVATALKVLLEEL